MLRALCASLAALLLLSAPAGSFKRTEVGDPLKDFRLPTLDGRPLVLSESLGGKATLVVFWATWNPRSAEILADFEKLFSEHEGRGLAVIAVNVEHQTELTAEEKESVRRTVEQLRLTYPIVLDQGLAASNDYGVVAVPSAILVDAQGKIAELLQGYAAATRYDFKDRVLAALGVAGPQPANATAALPPAEGKAYRYLQMGEIFLQRGMKERAEKAFRTSVAEDPGYVKAYEALAALLDEKGDAGGAAEIRQKIHSLAGK